MFHVRTHTGTNLYFTSLAEVRAHYSPAVRLFCKAQPLGSFELYSGDDVIGVGEEVPAQTNGQLVVTHKPRAKRPNQSASRRRRNRDREAKGKVQGFVVHYGVCNNGRWTNICYSPDIETIKAWFVGAEYIDLDTGGEVVGVLVYEEKQVALVRRSLTRDMRHELITGSRLPMPPPPSSDPSPRPGSVPVPFLTIVRDVDAKKAKLTLSHSSRRFELKLPVNLPEDSAQRLIAFSTRIRAEVAPHWPTEHTQRGTFATKANGVFYVTLQAERSGQQDLGHYREDGL